MVKQLRVWRLIHPEHENRSCMKTASKYVSQGWQARNRTSRWMPRQYSYAWVITISKFTLSRGPLANMHSVGRGELRLCSRTSNLHVPTAQDKRLLPAHATWLVCSFFPHCFPFQDSGWCRKLYLENCGLPGRGKKDMANHMLDFKTSGQELHKSLLTELAKQVTWPSVMLWGEKSNPTPGKGRFTFKNKRTYYTDPNKI